MGSAFDSRFQPFVASLESLEMRSEHSRKMWVALDSAECAHDLQIVITLKLVLVIRSGFIQLLRLRFLNSLT